ncbi:MAG: hypothetical protein A2428_07815 [Bdellovibrionales bacterium RIFOXYC1_FULL_54_43]|nr:MAG: hypothetical protein A2428_07815 [Bdellovibrionales bacterium RIFOXYC1_FULL_54_43]OFZ79035.1 MAG: hypothetical protein A2603_10125 [Bdellovibrionales bacterium RIFOXYD1_FULL_55_31]
MSHLPEAENSRPLFFKRRYILDQPLQFGIVGFFISLAVITIGIFCLAYYVLFKSLAENISLLDESSRNFLQTTLTRLNQDMIFNLVVFTVGILLYFLVGGILVSHRIAGPIHRIRMHLRAHLNHENPPPLKFRQQDFLKDLAEDINKITNNRP